MRLHSAPPRALVGALAACLLVLSALASPSLAAPGGGTVSNSAPTVTAFSVAGGASQTRLTAGVFSGSVEDKNGEARLDQISVLFTAAPAGVSPVRFDRALTAADLAQATEPAAFTAGWKVWDAVDDDGALQFKFQYAWAANGAYTARALVQDQIATDRSGPAPDLAITVLDGFSAAAHPVLADGTSDTGAAWGGWSALPGSTAVDSVNYLKVVNTGSNPAQPFTLDFSSAAFTGADLVTTFGLDGNVRFDCREGTAAQAPQDLAFDLGSAATSSTGSSSLAFTGLGNVYYCAYRIVALPEPLLDQDYTASYTVS